MNVKPPATHGSDQPDAEFQKLVEAYGKAASAGHHEKAEAIALQLLVKAGEAAVNNPTPDLLLHEEANQREAAGDLIGAEAAMQKLVTLHEDELAESKGRHGESAKKEEDARGQKEAWRCCAFITKAYLKLSAFQSRNGKLDEAWTSALAATAAARRTDLSPILRMALDNEAECALARNDVARALVAATEAVQVVEPGEIFDTARTLALILRARCLVANGDYSRAEIDLAASWKLLKPRSTSLMMAGLQNAIAEWWEVTAKVRDGEGDGKGAVKAWRKAVERRKHIAQLPQVNSSRALRTLKNALKNLSDALRKIGDEKASNRVLAEAEAIRT